MLFVLSIRVSAQDGDAEDAGLEEPTEGEPPAEMEPPAARDDESTRDTDPAPEELTPPVDVREPEPQEGRNPGEQRLRRARRKLDETLREAAKDLALDPVSFQPATERPIAEETLVEQAAEGWAVAPQLFLHGGRWVLRLSVVRPRTRTILVRRQVVSPDVLEVRAIQMLRALSSEPMAQRKPPRPKVHPDVRDSAGDDRSSGRAILAAHGALVGGYVGFSLEHIGGSGEERLVYPLMTLGAGAGVGASLIIAEEWDTTTAEAWYLWAAGTWPTVSGILIADAQPDATDSSRYGYGLLGAASGLTLGAVALGTGEVSHGGALFTHSGAAFGALFGGLGEMLAEGDTQVTPTLGIGVGTGAGVLIAGALAPRFGKVSPSRVLFVDLSATLGGLVGAAVASPLLVGNELTEAESRGWVGSIATGVVLGSVVGLTLTRNERSDASNAPEVRPFIGTARFGSDVAPTETVVGFEGFW